jgi:hypothetical protein
MSLVLFAFLLYPMMMLREFAFSSTSTSTITAQQDNGFKMTLARILLQNGCSVDPTLRKYYLCSSMGGEVSWNRRSHSDKGQAVSKADNSTLLDCICGPYDMQLNHHSESASVHHPHILYPIKNTTDPLPLSPYIKD